MFHLFISNQNEAEKKKKKKYKILLYGGNVK